MLKVHNITKRFGGVRALSNVSFEVRAEEVVALVGPNGAGKTTLFNIISGAVKPDEGKIIFKDEDITDLSPVERVKRGISRTFQNIRLFDNMNVLENILVGFHINYRYSLIDAFLRLPKYFIDENRARKKAIEIATFVGISNYLDKKVKNLPYGIRKKVEIARALATNGDLLLLDEPAAGLTDVETEELALLIKLINLELEKTILFIEHDMNFLRLVAHRVVVLDYGKVIFDGLPQDMFRDERVISAYLGGEIDEDVIKAKKGERKNV